MEINPDFPLWLRASHLINFVLIGILLLGDARLHASPVVAQ